MAFLPEIRVVVFTGESVNRVAKPESHEKNLDDVRI
jgi:hypothetical protein